MSNDKLNEILLAEWKTLTETTLNYAQVACPKDNWSALRSRLLRASNDFIRNLRDKLGIDLTTEKD